MKINIRHTNIASAGNLTVKHPNAICHIARQLIKAGHDPDTKVEIYRGKTLCFNPAPLSYWAALAVRETDDRSVSFKKYTPMPTESDHGPSRSASKPFR